ncbi:UDP-N-acetylmuramate--L-alanine ligase [Candidatus Falkowbacteria bacterium]|nr:MAG: UDP-N-acetylmuramate--L-alanine ligase [Candidatus Falkowbacteria bacterium]
MLFKKIKKIYMIGIKGVGMTMLAQFLSAKGNEVIGSDTKEVFMTDKVLKNSGIKVIEGFNAANMPKDANLIIYSTAYNAKTNVEVAKALEGKIKIVTYAEALGAIFNEQYGVAVVGSHGKTTTTAWLGYVLEGAGKSPSVMVGASVPQFNGTSLIGKSELLVVEADEYQNKLKHFNPRAVILNNIDYDHPDFFPSEEEYKQVFIDFIKKIPKSGFLAVNFNDPIIRKIASVNTLCKVISYAIKENADYVAYDIRQDREKQYFKVKLGVSGFTNSHEEDEEVKDSELGDFSIRLIGRHNILNALAVIAASIELGVDLHIIRKYLEEFKGTARRMEIMGDFRGAAIIDDYAHHPTEIKTTLAGAREIYKNNRLVVVFHPHTFTRTKALFNDFAESFSGIDELIVLDIYGSAREEHGGVHSRDLVELIKKQKNKKIHSTSSGQAKKQIVKYIPTLKKCEEYLRNNIERDDVVILMGAGDVFRIGEKLVGDK